MIKISIVFLYLRIFRGNLLKYLVWATQAVNVAVAIIFIVGLFFGCQPLRYYWAFADDTEGTCHDYLDFDNLGVYRKHHSSPFTILCISCFGMFQNASLWTRTWLLTRSSGPEYFSGCLDDHITCFTSMEAQDHPKSEDWNHGHDLSWTRVRPYPLKSSIGHECVPLTNPGRRP